MKRQKIIVLLIIIFFGAIIWFLSNSISKKNTLLLSNDITQTQDQKDQSQDLTDQVDQYTVDNEHKNNSEHATLDSSNENTIQDFSFIESDTFNTEQLMLSIDKLKALGPDGFYKISQQVDLNQRDQVLKRQSLILVLHDFTSDAKWMSQLNESEKKQILSEAQRVAQNELQSPDYIELPDSENLSKEDKQNLSHLGIVVFNRDKPYVDTSLSKMAAINLYSTIPNVTKDDVKKAASSRLNPYLEEYVELNFKD